MSTLTTPAPQTLRILGIDPGLQTTGFGVVDMTGSRLQYVASGVIETTRGDMGNLPARLKVIYDGVREIQSRYQADVASVEIVFVNVNPQSTLLLGQARGAAITALVAQKLPVSEYTALQVKQSVVGHGKAAKQQVAHMVMRLLMLPGEPGSDAADALACAICHAHASQGLGQLAAPGRRQRGGRLLALADSEVINRATIRATPLRRTAP